MTVKCVKCKTIFDDAVCWTLCPHNPLDIPHDAAYCREHDLFNCPLCPGSTFERDAYGIVKAVEG